MRFKELEPWRKNLYIIWAAQFIAMMGMSAVVPFLPFYIRDLGVTTHEEVARWSGYVFSAPFLFAFFLTPVWGFLGDRYGRKLMVVRAVFGLAISQILIGLSQNVEMLFLFRMLQGAISGFIAAALSLVSANTPPERSGYALGVLQTSTAAGSVLGPLVGGPLSDALGYRPIFFIVAGLCILSGFMVIRMVNEAPRQKSYEPKHSLSSNYAHAFRSPAIRTALALIFITQVSVLMIQPVFALYIEYLEPNKAFLATIAGVIFSIAGIFMVISAPWWGKRNDAKSYKKNLTIAIAGASVAYLLQGVVTQAYQLVLLRALQGFCVGGILPTLYSYISKNTALSRRGGMMGIASSFNVLANLFGPTVGGYVAAYVGLRENFYITSGVLVLSLVFLRRSFVDLRGTVEQSERMPQQGLAEEGP
ncbi:MAG TPA: MFS transporter [Bacteroidota bacterium]|nr:MFS transporter [Bacteroidota bacterium]